MFEKMRELDERQRVDLERIWTDPETRAAARRSEDVVAVAMALVDPAVARAMHRIRMSALDVDEIRFVWYRHGPRSTVDDYVLIENESLTLSGDADAAIWSVGRCRDEGSIAIGPVTLHQAISLVDRIPSPVGERVVAPEGQDDVDRLIAEFDGLGAPYPTP